MKPLIVVSGLPRSGTSLMMGALQAGGVALVTDQLREADHHNQVGYFEHEKVKTLEQDATWLENHRGQAVKVIYRLLYYLPEELPVKLLFMRRDVREVVASQNAMLGEPEGVGDWSRILVRELIKLDRWLASRAQIRVLNVAHRRIFDEGATVFREVEDFLERSLDLEAMAESVRPDLYRQKASRSRQN